MKRTLLSLAAGAALLAPALAPRLPAAEFIQQEPAGFSVRFDGSGHEEVYATATDAQGNVYVVGRSSSAEMTTQSFSDLPANISGGNDLNRNRFGPIGTPGTSLGTAGYPYLFVTKLNREGQVVWQRSAGYAMPYNGTHTAATGVAVDGSGNVFVTGSISATTRFGGITVDPQAPGGAPTYEGNIFVGMLDADGLWKWVKIFSPTVYATDSSGTNTVAKPGGYVYFRNGAPGNGNSNINTLTPRAPGRADGHSLQLGPDGSVYIQGTMEYGYVQPGGNNSIVWMRFGGTGLTGTGRIALGQSRPTGSTTYLNTSFIAKLRAVPPALGSPAGTPSTYEWDWMTPVTSGVTAQANGSVLSVDAGTFDSGLNGNIGNSTSRITDFKVEGDSVYLTGNWRGTNILANNAGTNHVNSQEGFVARLDSASGLSVYLSGYSLGAAGANNFGYGGAIAVDAARNAYVTGAIGNNSGTNYTVLTGRSVTNATNFQGSHSAPNNTQSCFVAKLDATGNWQWVASPTYNTIIYAHATSIARDSSGALYIGGSIQAPTAGTGGIATFGSSVVYGSNHPSQNALTAYVAKLTDLNNVRTWQWTLQTQPNGSGTFTTPIMDTADVRAGYGGTIYWAINSLAHNGAFATGRSPVNGDTTHDTTSGRGAFLLPILPDAPYISPNFAIFNSLICGQEVTPPAGVYLDQNSRPSQPDIVLPAAGNASGAAYFHWDTFGKRLYAISPVLADIRWPVSADPVDSQRVVRRTLTRWPQTRAEGLTYHVTGAGPDGNEPSVNLQPPNAAVVPPRSPHTFATLLYHDSDAQVSGQKVFSAKRPGYAVLLYTVGANTALGSAPVTLEVVQTRLWNDPVFFNNTFVIIGTPIDPSPYGHGDLEGRNGYVVQRRARIDAAGTTPAYDFNTRLGDIIPVNENGASATETLTVVYSVLNGKGVAWPENPQAMTPQWPNSPMRIVIASGLGSEVYAQPKLVPATYANPAIYHQPDTNLAGYNPNEEHAFFAAPQAGGAEPAVFALRGDLNHVGRTTSEPYVLVRYQDPSAGLKPRFLVYRVSATSNTYTVGNTTYAPYTFTGVPGQAGKRVQSPYPLSLLGDAPGTSGSGDPYFKDRKNSVWARCAGTLTARYFYPLQPTFWYDLNGDGTQDDIAFVPWLDRLPGGTIGTPQAVTYAISWPTPVAQLSVGETVTTSRNDVPGVENMASATVVFEEGRPTPTSNLSKFLVRIVPYVEERWVPLDGVVSGTDLVVGSATFPVQLADGGRYKFANLPFHLKVRLLFDPINKRLIYTGYKDAENYLGAPLLLLNVLAVADRNSLRALQPDNAAWQQAVDDLYALTRNPNGAPSSSGIPQVGLRAATGSTTLFDHADALGPKALTAGLAGATGYVTIIENNAPELSGESIEMHVIQVVQPNLKGEIKVILSDNALDEKITLRHSGDFGGDANGKIFEWFYKAATTSVSPLPPHPTTPLGSGDGPGYSGGWTSLASGNGVDSVVIEGAGLRTLADSWVFVRYRGNGGVSGGAYSSTFTTFAGDPASAGTPLAAFVPGWIKRVLEGLNPFEARVRDFAAAPTQTYSSFLVSAGTRYEGPVALNSSAANLNSLGLIALYETVIRRGFDLSINGTPAQTNNAVNNALLLAATRISDLYMLIGNEAYADAQDPTVGFTSSDGVGSLAPSLFAFQNQLPNLISEELGLLRGRDDSSAGVGAAPIYNRLFWNFTSGLEGEPAYVQNYGITDQPPYDGFINEADARKMFPQGHGDAWGHYLTAVKSHYRLLRHPLYTWIPRAETTLIGGVGVEVDYTDEQKFAAAAAARATAGAEIVNLTYRDRYVADPAGQWQGYRDTNTDRAWGVEEWGRRAGQGAFFDWAVANAILPSVHAHLLSNPSSPPPTGLQKIDRTTVTELTKIATAFAKVQTQLDQADQGLNPLGLTPGAISFDIDPNFFSIGSTASHFEQIFQRAMAAVNNARSVFDYASELTNRLRQTQLTSNQFALDSAGQEYEYRNRLIEIFGYPYAGDIGGAGKYPTGYDGPDIYHYNYVPVTTVSGTSVVPDTALTGFFAPFGQEFKAPPTGAVNASSFTQVVSHYFPGDCPNGTNLAALPDLPINFPIATASSWSFVAPAAWGQRRASGRLQQGISDMVRAEAELRRGILDYNNHLANIQDQLDLLIAQSGMRADQITVLDRQRNTVTGMNAAIGILQGVSTSMNTAAAIVDGVASTAVEAVPKVLGLATDGLSGVRAAIVGASKAIYITLHASAGVSDIAANSIELAKERLGLTTEIEIQGYEATYEAQQQIKVIEALMREEVGLRLDLFNLQQSLRDASGAYLATLAEGQRVLEERFLFRRKVAGAVQATRYQDLTFRIFRNDALQKYRAAFDLAARYAYLAATTYDYETVQLGSSAAAGRKFLTDIVRERALGQYSGDGNPVNGVNGLSDPLARLSQNFAVLKGRLGINNPQIETGQFSIRQELFRILPDSDEAWRDQLQVQRVPNLWSVPEFRRFCRPFAPESAGAQPGLVISFSTSVTFGLNFFGLPLGGGDSSYDSSQFATKISSVGVWFDNYDGQGLANTPRVYLVPAGTDILRAPNDVTLGTREFDVVDQAIPTPFPIGASNLQSPTWIPSNDSVDVPFNEIRQQSRFRAYHDGGLNPAQLTGDTRLVGRSVWNTKWMLIIPGGTLLNDPNNGLETFIKGRLIPGSTTERDGNGVKDIKLFFETYSYSGN